MVSPPLGQVKVKSEKGKEDLDKCRKSPMLAYDHKNTYHGLTVWMKLARGDLDGQQNFHPEIYKWKSEAKLTK